MLGIVEEFTHVVSQIVAVSIRRPEIYTRSVIVNLEWNVYRCKRRRTQMEKMMNKERRKMVYLHDRLVRFGLI